jgi:hypothetical protein
MTLAIVDMSVVKKEAERQMNDARRIVRTFIRSRREELRDNIGPERTKDITTHNIEMLTSDTLIALSEGRDEFRESAEADIQFIENMIDEYRIPHNNRQLSDVEKLFVKVLLFGDGAAECVEAYIAEHGSLFSVKPTSPKWKPMTTVKELAVTVPTQPKQIPQSVDVQSILASTPTSVKATEEIKPMPIGATQIDVSFTVLNTLIEGRITVSAYGRIIDHPKGWDDWHNARLEDFEKWVIVCFPKWNPTINLKPVK